MGMTWNDVELRLIVFGVMVNIDFPRRSSDFLRHFHGIFLVFPHVDQAGTTHPPVVFLIFPFCPNMFLTCHRPFGFSFEYF